MEWAGSVVVGDSLPAELILLFEFVLFLWVPDSLLSLSELSDDEWLTIGCV